MTLKKNLGFDVLVLDFDGVLTDNKVYTFDDGKEAVRCTRADGFGLKMLRQAGVRIFILSTEANPVVTMRGKKLGLDVFQNIDDKLSFLQEFCEREGISRERLAYIGNDINDLDAMQWVGFPVAPQDGMKVVQKIAKLIVPVNGGDGVVRWFAEHMLFERVTMA